MELGEIWRFHVDYVKELGTPTIYINIIPVHNVCASVTCECVTSFLHYLDTTTTHQTLTTTSQSTCIAPKIVQPHSGDI